MIAARVESFTERLEELQPLLAAHWEKLAEDRDSVSLAPQYDAYLKLDAAGRIVFVTLRDDGILVGYWVALIQPGFHYKHCLEAHMDVWNVLPAYESGTGILILMREVEREYKRRGVQRAFAGEKLQRPCGRLYKAFGYRPVQVVHSKMMEK